MPILCESKHTPQHTRPPPGVCRLPTRLRLLYSPCPRLPQLPTVLHQLHIPTSTTPTQTSPSDPPTTSSSSFTKPTYVPPPSSSKTCSSSAVLTNLPRPTPLFYPNPLRHWNSSWRFVTPERSPSISPKSTTYSYWIATKCRSSTGCGLLGLDYGATLSKLLNRAICIEVWLRENAQATHLD